MPQNSTSNLPSTQPTLHFAHANSYPAGTYKSFFNALREHYRVQALEMHGHNPRYPVRDGWRELAHELRDELRARYREPVVLVGHSLGGVLCLRVAREHPELVRAVVLLDAPVVAGWRARLLQVFKSTGWGKHYSPAVASRQRRNHWVDADEAYHHYRQKPMFAIWPPEVLRAYIEHGTVQHENGLRLRFSPETETSIYETIPHDIGKVARAPFPVPVGFVGGLDSRECKQAGLKATRRLVGKHFKQIPGGHLFPMEHPIEAAQVVHQLVQELLSER